MRFLVPSRCTCFHATRVFGPCLGDQVAYTVMLNVLSSPVFIFQFNEGTMAKKPASKKGKTGDVLMSRPEDDTTATAATVSPRVIRQRTWTKRVDDTVIEMRHVQQLLQKHTVEVTSLKRELEELTYTAAAFWAAKPEELPAQYKDKQSRGNSPRSPSGWSSDTTPTKRRGGPVTGSPSTSLGGGVISAVSEVAVESVEHALLQLSPAQRGKVSTALQSLFYATPVAPPTSVVMDAAGGDCTGGPPSSEVDGASELKPASPAKHVKAAEAAASDGKSSTAATARQNVIPQPLLLAMKELQAKRIILEEQLAKATHATAQQLKRFHLLQEELMVSQYGLDAVRKDLQTQVQEQQHEASSEGVPGSS
ncbi:hypothetical protein, conserved [Leishmania tarentolae]|uniref:Uncharacterized protein n=1 Tax=Leishmania tarentolae TaxID=5689 RepID=A0A640KNE1_LEITA|nr:hypothetical protein, conserved [Leishmania tarentolae]